jgi:hypothetical protein
MTRELWYSASSSAAAPGIILKVHPHIVIRLEFRLIPVATSTICVLNTDKVTRSDPTLSRIIKHFRFNMSDMGDWKGAGDWGNRNEAGWKKADDQTWPGTS